MTSVGVLGGTFDPVHCGHIRLAIETREHLGLDVVRLMPAPNPRLRTAPTADAALRLALVRLAVHSEPGLEVDERELARSGPTYTVDTLEELRAELPGAAITLILGMDAFARLPGWHRWERLLELCHLAIAHRPDAEPPVQGEVGALLDRHATGDPARLRHERAGLIYRCPVPMLEISATRIRALLASGRSTRCLLPDPVHELLQKETVYTHA